ncbi:hypothetical protein [Pyrobaculum ferrireducens]|uniref:Uncharacterized protein n=1 Tax=Pyrobaculum ferrireducens TaxID=1104324 RepID=G7VAI7_9CREN|nr:hypothetical protein [Pyrobaculum ferrireducens]AET32226.1 hypothetical protein P186_0780 [Pyrobaculum ferrireducens]
MDFFLLLLFLDFLLNRTLNRLWIFVPHNAATYLLFLGIQWGGYISMLALYVYSFMLIGSWGRRGLIPGAAALLLTALDLAHDYLHVGVKGLFVLPAVFSMFFRERAAAGYSLYYLAEGVVKAVRPAYLPHMEWIWALLPLLGGWRFSKKAVALSLVAALFVSASPYYAGMIMVFGMGLTQVFLFPIAVYLSMSSKSRYPIYALLVGPTAQLSVHYIALAVAVGHVGGGKQQR